MATDLAAELDFEMGKRSSCTTENDGLQVIVMGLPRTGSSSLKAALAMLGVGSVEHMAGVFGKVKQYYDFTSLLESHVCRSPEDKCANIPAAGLNNSILETLMEGYAATIGSPTCCLVPELLSACPDAKVLLHVRSSDDEWYQSFHDTIGSHHEIGTLRKSIHDTLTFTINYMESHCPICYHVGRYWRQNHGKVGPQTHSLHNERMMRLVSPERLLVYDVKEGWGPLCAFLEVPVPNVPFPRVIDTVEMNRRHLFLKAYGILLGMIYASVVAVAVYLALNGFERVYRRQS